MSAALDLLTAGEDTSLAERSFIGALLHRSAEDVIEAATRVRKGDFADPRLAAIYAGCVRVAATGQAPTPPAVDAHLRAAGEVRGSDRAAVVALLADLYGEVPIPAAVHSYGRAVVEAAVRRAVLASSVRVTRAADEAPVDVLHRVAIDEANALVIAVLRLVAPLEVAA